MKRLQAGICALGLFLMTPSQPVQALTGISFPPHPMRGSRLRHGEALEFLGQVRKDLELVQQHLVRMRELAAMSAVGSVSQYKRALLNLEYQDHIGAIESHAQSSQWREIPLLLGGLRRVELQTRPTRDHFHAFQRPTCTALQLGIDVTTIHSVAEASNAMAWCDSAILVVLWSLNDVALAFDALDG